MKFVRKLKRTISLDELKGHDALAEMPLLRKGNRLSVMPVDAADWKLHPHARISQPCHRPDAPAPYPFIGTHPMSNANEKRQAGEAAIRYVEDGAIVGVGTGSTVAFFIDALADLKDRIQGAVSSSEQSTAHLKRLRHSGARPQRRRAR